METNVLRTPYVDLKEISVKSVSSVRRATSEMYAQFNRWCEDNEYPRGLRAQSILVNKVLYYAEKEVQKRNDEFRIDTGWYLYGPCYEGGRTFEVSKRPINIVPVSEGVSDELANVCEELVPRFAADYKAGGVGGVLRNFLAHIYSEKCDHDELREYYQAKHGLQCQLWAYSGLTEFDPTEQAKAVTQAVTRFDRVLLGSYPKAVGLDRETLDLLLEFTPLFEEYAHMAAEGSDSRLLLEVLDRAGGFILSGLAHLNYAHTFESFNAIHTGNMKKTQRQRAHKKLGLAGLENQRLYDAYGSTLRSAA